MKTCNHCFKAKELSEFAKQSCNKDGYRPYCKSCNKEKNKDYYDKNRERIKAKYIPKKNKI